MEHRKLGRWGVKVSEEVVGAACLRDDGVASVIVGASMPAHVDDNVAAGSLTIDDAALDRFDEILARVAA